MKLKDFFKKKKIAAGCIAAVITAGSLAMVWQGSQVPELPNYTDPVIEQTIEDDDTPLASAPKVTTKTTRNTKTTRKNIKLKKHQRKHTPGICLPRSQQQPKQPRRAVQQLLRHRQLYRQLQNRSTPRNPEM